MPPSADTVPRVTYSAPLGLTDGEAALQRSRGLGNDMPPVMGRTYREIVRENVFTFVNGVIFVWRGM